MPSQPTQYVAYEIRIRSDIVLPELRSAQGGEPPDVTIVVDQLAEMPRLPEGVGIGVRDTGNGTYLEWKGIGSFLVRGGAHITCEPAPGVSTRRLRLPLLGVVMGIVLHQRGLLTLHASALAIDGEGVAFIGWKGAGKSTTAAALQARGHTLLTDDVLALDCDENGVLQVLPAFPQIKLRPDSAVGLGYDPSALSTLGEHIEKRALRPADRLGPRPIPLRRIYLLEEGPMPSVDRVRGAESFAALVAQTYAPRFLGASATTPQHFNQCHRLANQVPVYRLTRPKEFSRMNEWLEAVEAGAVASFE